MDPYSTSSSLQSAPGYQHGMYSQYQEDYPNEQHDTKVATRQSQPCRRVFRRPRAGRACGMCHSRRVRCDAGSRGTPCTNCEAFFLDCSIPPRKKNRQGTSVNDKRKASLISGSRRSIQSNQGEDEVEGELPRPVAADPEDFASLILQADQHIAQQPDTTKTYVKLISPGMSSSAIENPGRVAYLQEKSTLAFLLNEYTDSGDTVHYPLPEIDGNGKPVATKMNEVEMEILRKRGALELPPRDICEELIEAYFKWVAPVVPIINKTRFMQQWHDLGNQPSLLLLQAMLLAGSRVCTTSILLDENGSPIPSATIFYKRAKALYDADYEEDRIIIVQALILLGWYWEEPGVVTKNVFYWNGLAATIAHGFGMHRSSEGSRLSQSDKRLWKRIWWTLYVRDRSVSVALGRPAHINLEDSDVEMIVEEDFIDDCGPQDHVQVQFFLQYIKICEVMDIILDQHYSLKSRQRERSSAVLQTCELALNDWLQNCPTQVRWNPLHNDQFWPAYLYSIYNTVKCLLHRAYLPTVASLSEFHSKLDISHNAAFQSASAITSITESLIARNEIKQAPPFLIYALLSALIIHVYELQTEPSSANIPSHKRIYTCMSALDKLSDVWLVAKMVQDLFETILTAAGLGIYTMEDTKRYKQIGAQRVPVYNFIPMTSATLQSPGTHKNKTHGLTTALLAHRDATLNYVTGTGSSKHKGQDSDTSLDSSDCNAPSTQSLDSMTSPQHPREGVLNPVIHWANCMMPAAIQGNLQYQDSTSVQNMNYMPNQMGWIQPDFQNMIPTTLNVGDWFDYFGMR